MRRIIAIIVSLAVLASLLISGMTFSFAEAAEEPEFTRFTATGNDPYATFKFSDAGKNVQIDPDTCVWAAIKYRTISEKDNTGVPFKGQLYITPAAEPFVPITYTFSKNWEIAIIDCLATGENATVDSKWDSDSYLNTGTIRFDPLESDRDAEAQTADSDEAVVSDGDQIDIAWIAFFEKEEDAKAYTGVEDTPYCLLDSSSFTNFSAGNHIQAERFVNGEAAGTPTPAVPHTGEYALYDKSKGTNTGYWMNPIRIDDSIDVSFEVPDWMVGIQFYAFCSENDVYIDLEVIDDHGNVLFTGRQVCFSNSLQEMSFGKAFPPGYYTFSFIACENEHFPDGAGQHFVLGSGYERDDLSAEDIEITGFDNSTSVGVPQIIIFTGDEDPNYQTPEPTAVPEVTPEPPTEEPTETPAPEEPTEEPVQEATPTAAPEKKGCGNVIGGGIALIAVAAAAFVARKKH
ncbi:MAG: hypothetical protein IJS71_09045 [Clostridia bacterium]|nr:hypothetical protein [Clostridia bacterium]